MSATVTVWLQRTLVPHASKTCQVRVISQGQLCLLVTVLRAVTVGGGIVMLQGLAEEGSSKVQAEPHSTVLSAGHGGAATLFTHEPLIKASRATSKAPDSNAKAQRYTAAKNF